MCKLHLDTDPQPKYYLVQLPNHPVSWLWLSTYPLFRAVQLDWGVEKEVFRVAISSSLSWLRSSRFIRSLLERQLSRYSELAIWIATVEKEEQL